jgi:hypothetical protein
MTANILSVASEQLSDEILVKTTAEQQVEYTYSKLRHSITLFGTNVFRIYLNLSTRTAFKWAMIAFLLHAIHLPAIFDAI